MCYSIHFSTDSSEDFACLETENFKVCPAELEPDSAVGRLLGYAHRWHLLSRHGGCSCHYRHSTDHEFATVQDWYPEDEDDVETTGHAYDLLRRITSDGHRLDLVDIWSDEPTDNVRSIDVSLSEVQRDQFRFFAGVRFELTG